MPLTTADPIVGSNVRAELKRLSLTWNAEAAM
jgi:hypothetical protein